MTLELNMPSSCLPAGQYKPHHVGYDTWLSHCKDLKTAANILMKDSSSFRGNLRFSGQCKKTLRSKADRVFAISSMMTI